MNKITPHEFYEMTNGKIIDVDGAYGGQCWDLFAYYCQQVLGRTFSCVKTGYVADFWNYFNECGLEPYFEKVTGNYQDGDWLLYTQPCFCTDSSHICMFRCYNAGGSITVLSQNPGATGQYAWPNSGITGALRLKPQYNYAGSFDAIDLVKDNRFNIRGWYWNGLNDEAMPVHIYIRKDNENKFVVGINASEYREDLKNAGKGNGNHAFNYEYDFDNLGAGTYDITVYQIRYDGNNQPMGTKTITITEKVVETPIIEEPIAEEPTTPSTDNDTSTVVEDSIETDTNNTEEDKVSKNSFKSIILTIIKKILEYIKERYNNDKKNFKSN